MSPLANIVPTRLRVSHVLAAPAVGAFADRARRRKPMYAALLATCGAAIAVCGVLAGRAPAGAVLTGGIAVPAIPLPERPPATGALGVHAVPGDAVAPIRGSVRYGRSQPCPATGASTPALG